MLRPPGAPGSCRASTGDGLGIVGLLGESAKHSLAPLDDLHPGCRLEEDLHLGRREAIVTPPNCVLPPPRRPRATPSTTATQRGVPLCPSLAASTPDCSPASTPATKVIRFLPGQLVADRRVSIGSATGQRSRRGSFTPASSCVSRVNWRLPATPESRLSPDEAVARLQRFSRLLLERRRQRFARRARSLSEELWQVHRSAFLAQAQAYSLLGWLEAHRRWGPLASLALRGQGQGGHMEGPLQGLAIERSLDPPIADPSRLVLQVLLHIFRRNCIAYREWRHRRDTEEEESLKQYAFASLKAPSQGSVMQTSANALDLLLSRWCFDGGVLWQQEIITAPSPTAAAADALWPSSPSGRPAALVSSAAPRASAVPQWQVRAPDEEDEEADETYGQRYRRGTALGGLERFVTEQEWHTFDYKMRRNCGGLLHVAVNEKQEAAAELLLLGQADPNAKYVSIVHARTLYAHTMHIAAGRGALGIMRLLITFRARVNEPSTIAVSRTDPTQRPHYTPLHEAVWFDRRDATSLLLECRADVGARNELGETPLHTVGRRLDSECLDALLLARGNLEDTCTLSTTCSLTGRPAYEVLKPLQYAVRYGLLAGDKLPLLAKEPLDFRDLLMVAQSCTEETTTKFLRMRQRGDADVEGVAELLSYSPVICVNYLEKVFLNRPSEQDHLRHPLPPRADLTDRFGSVEIRCEYQPTKVWEYDVTSEHWSVPAWHHKLCKPPSRRRSGRLLGSSRGGAPAWGQDIAVEVQVLSLPGVLDLRIMHGLSEMHPCYLHIFAEKVVQGIVSCAWHHLVGRAVAIDLLVQGCVLGALMAVVACTEGEASVAQVLRWCWPVIAAGFARELVYDLGQLSARGLLFGRASMLKLDALVSSLDTLLLGWFALQTCGATHLPSNKSALAFATLSRWARITYSLRTFEHFEMIVPILQSFLPLKGMMFVASLIFAGFASAILAIRGNKTMYEVFGDVFSALIVTDGSPYDRLFEIASRESGVAGEVLIFSAVIIWLYCVSNLVTSTYSNVYDKKQGDAKLLFLKARAEISLQFMLRPAFRSWLGSAQVAFLACSGAVVMAGAAVFLAAGENGRQRLHAWPQSVSPVAGHLLWATVLALLVIVIEARQLGRNWHPVGQSDCLDFHLWLCVRRDFSAAKLTGKGPDSEEAVDVIRSRLEELSMQFASFRVGGVAAASGASASGASAGADSGTAAVGGAGGSGGLCAGPVPPPLPRSRSLGK